MHEDGEKDAAEEEGGRSEDEVCDLTPPRCFIRLHCIMKNKFNFVQKVGKIPVYTTVKIEGETSSASIKEAVLACLRRVGEGREGEATGAWHLFAF